MEKDAANLLNDLKQTQVEISTKKEQLKNIFLDGESGDGLVIVTITANKKVVNIAIDNSILDNKNELEDHLITALNKALEKASEIRETEISLIKKQGFPYDIDF